LGYVKLLKHMCANSLRNRNTKMTNSQTLANGKECTHLGKRAEYAGRHRRVPHT